MMAKTFETLTSSDWSLLRDVVVFAAEMNDDDTYGKAVQLQQAAGLLTDLHAEWREKHQDLAKELFDAVNLTDKKHANV